MAKTFSVRYHEPAIEDLRRIHVFAQRRILEEVDEQLSTEPTTANRRRKLLRPRGAGAGEGEPVWQLRVGAFRVFYDVDVERHEVLVVAIRRKGRRTTEEIA